MASVHRDPRSKKGIWYAAYTLASGQRVFRSTRCHSKSQARLLADCWEAAEREAAQGTLTRNRATAILNETLARSGQTLIERVSIQEWLMTWLASKKPSVSAASFQAYSQTIREFLEHLGEKGVVRALETISERDIQSFLDVIRESGRSAGTSNKIRSFLSAPFALAHKVGKIPFNPVSAISPARTDTARKGTFTPEQIVALLRVAPDDWTGAILFSYGSGARLSDVANLSWAALDVVAGVVTYREQKTRATVLIGLHPDFLDWLAGRPVPQNPDDPVFPELFGRSSGGHKGLSTAFQRLIAEAGIENRPLRPGRTGKGHRTVALSFHSLRHGAASSVFNNASLREIARRVSGHAAGGVLDRYIHEDVQAIKAATALIPRLPL